MSSTDRKSGLDVLRVVSMLMVITQHYMDKGGVLNAAPLSFSWCFGSFVSIACYPCVLLFVLITGYFLPFQHTYSVKNKVLNIWKTAIFYSFLILAAVMIFFRSQVNWGDVLKSIFPILFRNWGFVNNYIFLVLLSPAINRYLVNATEKGLKKTIMLLTVIQCIIPYLTMQDSFNTEYGNSIVWFGYIYILGFYIRKFNVQEKYSLHQLGLVAILCVGFTSAVKLFIAAVTCFLFGEVRFSGAFVGETPIFNVIYALALFGVFLKIELRESKCVRILGSTSFAVYLVHEHPLIRNILWSALNVKSVSQYNPLIQILHWLISIAMIYLTISAIDLIRQLLFGKIQKVSAGKN